MTTPYLSYLSLQTALYQHGIIEQIPSMIFLVSIARSGRVETGFGTYSVHHVRRAFFDGFESLQDSGIKLTPPEKALVDFLYRSPTRSRLLAALPELELPRPFRRSMAREWVGRIPSWRPRTIAARRLDEVLARAISGGRKRLPDLVHTRGSSELLEQRLTKSRARSLQAARHRPGCVTRPARRRGTPLADR